MEKSLWERIEILMALRRVLEWTVGVKNAEIFSFPPAVVSHVSLPWSQQINGENSGRGVQCHPPPVAGAEEESLVPVPDQVMLHGSKLLNLAGGPRQGVVIVLQAPIYFLRN